MPDPMRDDIRQRCLEVEPDLTGEPSLAAILLTLNAVRPQLRITCSASGRFNVWDDRTQTYGPGASWQLRLDSLDQQSLATVEFLHALLCEHA